MTTFYFDYETFAIQPGCLAPPPVCISYAIDGGEPAILHAQDPRFRKLLHAALHTPGVIIVAHNAAFEAAVTMAYEPAWIPRIAEKVEAGEWVCTMILEKLLRIGQGDHRDGFALDDCMDAHKLPHMLDKESPCRDTYGLMWDKPVSEWPEDYRNYSLGDVCVRELYKALCAKDPKFRVNAKEQMMAAVALTSTSAWGIATDGETSQVLFEETIERLEGYRLDLLDPQGRLGIDATPLLRYEVKKGVPTPVRNTKDARERCAHVYKSMGREPPRGDVTASMYLKAYATAGIPELAPVWSKAEKDRVKITARMLDEACEEGVPADLLLGNVSVDEEACTLSGDPLLVAYSFYGQASGLLKKIRRPLTAAELGYPIQPSYNVLVNTGRTSCRQGDEPEPGQPWMTIGLQVQNLPRAGLDVEEEAT